MSTTANSGPERPAATPALLQRIANRVRRRPAATDPALEEIAIIEASGRFDKQWYLQHNPDVAGSGMDPIEHYVRHGADEGRDPVAGFNTDFYLHNNPDVAASGLNPFRHYIEHGANEGRPCRVSSPRNATTQRPPSAPGHDAELAREDMEAIARSGLFDSGYYLKKNPDVAASGMDPLLHFCRHGFRELRNPSRMFDVGWYWLTHLPEDITTNPLVHYLRGTGSGTRATRAAGKLSGDDKQALFDTAIELLDSERTHVPDLYVRLGIAMAVLKRWPDAEAAFSRALAQQWNNARVHARLAGVLARTGKWWQAAESWSAATTLDASHADWFFHLGEAQEQMNRFELAAEAYKRGIELNPGNPQWHYLLGYAQEKARRGALAAKAYATAIRLDPRREAKAFGIGVFHQARGYWREAAEAFANELKRQPASAELHYKLGMAFDRCYRWQDAERAYRDAIALNPETPYWHYRYGFVLERQQRYTEAAEAYAAGALLSPAPKPYWWYRRGYALAAAGRFKDACAAYLRTRGDQAISGTVHRTHEAPRQDADKPTQSAITGRDVPATGEEDNRQEWLHAYLQQFPTEHIVRAIERDSTDAEMRFRLGQACERTGDWPGAVQSYAAAVARSDPHRPDWYYRLGFALYHSGRLEEACDAFRQTRVIQRAYGISETTLANASLGVKLTTAYAEYLQTLRVNDKVILYESHIGKSISCSPLGIFRKLLVDPGFAGYTHVWVIDSPSRIPGDLRRLPNVIFVERLSDLYLRYLATAGYLINNTGFPPYFIRRKEQKYLATWHGTPLKTLGKQQTYKFLEHKRTQRNFLQATHIISPNPHTTGVLLDSYDIRHIMDGKLGETGYPRVDLTLNADEKERRYVLDQIGASGSRPVVLYAPTWRGTLETVAYDIERAKEDLRRLADHHDCDIVFRGHHLMEKVFSADEPIGCTVVPGTIDTNVLLSVVDVLITDYSSIFFDFLPTGRPVLYYIYDQESYETERGLYFSMDAMPGYKCSDIESLDSALGLALKGQIPDPGHYARSRETFNSHDDGDASQRVIDFFFHDDDTYVVNPGPHPEHSILMQGGGFQRNGITTSFLNLVKSVNGSRMKVTVALSPDGIESDPKCRELFDLLPETVPVVPRSGISTMTWEERWLRKSYEARPGTFAGERLELIRDLFDREYLRVFGRSRFDTAVAFSGYDAFWAAVLTLNRRSLRKAIYMHSDMREEYVARFPNLIRMFSLYGFADVLVSVCNESKECNLRHLSAWLHIPPERFVVCENTQDPDRIIEQARSAIEPSDEFLFGHGPVFINMARLSVEKDHAKLIRAFSRIHEQRPDAQLLILGAGPLHHALTGLTAKLGLSDCIHLLGYRVNPHAYIRRSNCFVLSSNHEAKTMSLIETLIIGKPFVATDIAGNRDIKNMYPQYFFENSESGLVEGMRQYLDGHLQPPVFDWRAHQAEALRQFETRIVGVH